MYCILCGNEEIDTQTKVKDGIGDQCHAIIEAAPMSRAMAFWRECDERFTRCCGGLSKDHLHFHGKDWECSYPPAPVGKAKKDGTHRKPTMKQLQEWAQFRVTVEMGVSFYPEYAQTYYLRDFDTDCDSVEFGKAIPYTTKKFWNTLNKQLDQAAKEAFNSDLLTCPECGYHYISSVGPCGCGDDE